MTRASDRAGSENFENLSPASKTYKRLEENVLKCITNVSKRGMEEQKIEATKLSSHLLARIDVLETKFNDVNSFLAKQQSESTSTTGSAQSMDPEVSMIVKEYADKTRKDLSDKAAKKPLPTDVAEAMKTLPLMTPSDLQIAAQAALQEVVKDMEGAPLRLLSGAVLVPNAQIKNEPFDNGSAICKTSSPKKVHDVLVRTYARVVFLSIMDVGLPVGFKYASLFNASCDWKLEDPLTIPLKACVSTTKSFYRDNKHRVVKGFQFLSTFLTSCAEGPQPLQLELCEKGPDKMPKHLAEFLSEEFRGHPSFRLTVTANVLVKKRQSDPGLTKIGRATFNICDTVATNCLHLAISQAQFRKLRKEQDGWAIRKLFSILTMDGSGVTFEQAFVFYKGCVDEILRMCFRGIAKTLDDIDGDVFGVFHHESLLKASKHRCYWDFSVMLSHNFEDWFKEVVVGAGGVAAAGPVSDEKETRMQRLKKLKELDEE